MMRARRVGIALKTLFNTFFGTFVICGRTNFAHFAISVLYLGDEGLPSEKPANVVYKVELQSYMHQSGAL